MYVLFHRFWFQHACVCICTCNVSVPWMRPSSPFFFFSFFVFFFFIQFPTAIFALLLHHPFFFFFLNRPRPNSIITFTLLPHTIFFIFSPYCVNACCCIPPHRLISRITRISRPEALFLYLPSLLCVSENFFFGSPLLLYNLPSLTLWGRKIKKYGGRKKKKKLHSTIQKKIKSKKKKKKNP